MIRSVVLVAGVRTPIGDFGKGLKEVPPTRLGALVIAAALARAGLAPEEVGHVVMGHVIPTEPRDAYLARVAAVEAGLPAEVPALTLNRLCGSGLEAIVSAAQRIALGDCDIALAGGAESMSRGAHLLAGLREGVRMGEAKLLDLVLGTLSDPFGNGHMGITAENVAAEAGIGRAAQDAFAAESHRRAARAQAEGRFASQIVPVHIPARKGETVVAQDEHVRADATADSLAALRPAFARDGSVTAGNASGLNDGAAAVVLMAEETAAARGLVPLGRLVAYAHAGVAPRVMGLGPIPAVRRALDRAGLAIADIDVIEANEAFAAQACAVAAELGFPPERTNPNGGAVALGHPVGATGAILMVKLLHELARTGGRRGLATMCIGGGQGIAAIVERPS